MAPEAAVQSDQNNDVPRLENLTLSQRAHTFLRDEILSNRLPPGTELQEVALSQQLGVSRGPIREALGRLRSAKLLAGVRGAPPADVDAVVRAVRAIDRLMQTVPELTEVDVNPLMVHAKGQGATALDALIVVR